MKKMNYALLSTMLIFGTLMPRQTILEDVRAGDKEAIRKRIENCENCAETDENGNNALHIAGEEGTKDHEEIIEMLTTEPDYSSWGNWFYGFMYAPTLPNKNAQNKNGKVPLHCSTERGHVGTTDKLLEKGANPKITDKDGVSPIFAMVKYNKPQLIPVISRHELIHQKQDGSNLLHYSIEHDRFTMVEKLAENSELTQEQNEQGKTAAMLASEKEKSTSLKILHAKGVSINARGSFGRQPIHSSAIAGSYENAKYLLEKGANVDSSDDNDNTPLLLSTAEGKKNVVDLFLAYKADPKKRNKQGKDILDVSVDNHQYELIKRFKEVPEVNIDRQDNFGRTVFMNATIAQNHAMMSELFNCGANPYITDHEGENSLHKVAKNGDTTGLSLLRNIFSNPQHWNKPNHNGDSPTFIAAQKGHLNTIKMLLHGGGSLDGTNNKGETIFHQFAQCKKKSVFIEIMKTYRPKANINAQSAEGFSAMHYASAYDNPEMMEAFTHCGASYTDITAQGDTLAHSAAASGALNSLKDLKHRMPMMLQQRNKNNHTPFITAAANGRFDSAQFLFCENDIINRDISIAISVARAHGHTHIVQSLEQVEKKRMDECVKIARQPQEIIEIEKQITSLHQELAQKDGAHFFNLLFDAAASPKQYSANELYYMTEAQRAQISLGYTEIHNRLLQRKRELKNKLNSFIAQEEEERRQERKRIREAKRQEQARIEEHNRRERELQDAREKNAAIEAQKKRELELKKQQHEADLAQKKELHYWEQKKLENDAAQKAQQAEIDRYNKEKAAKDSQQAILDKAAAAKALADKERARQQQHAQALEGQHIPVDLKPSTPPMAKQPTTYQCAACQKESSAKTLPCRTCPKRICNACQKQNGGQCPTCWQDIGKFAQKTKGECFINNNKIYPKTNNKICTETAGVTPIPCDNCKINADRICKGCLDACIKDNDIKGLQGKCPYCTQQKLNPKIIKIILGPKKLD